jgi:hypothetical protein
MRWLRPVLTLVLLPAFTLFCEGCNTPTLPIPPPMDAALTAPDPDGYVEVVVDVPGSLPAGVSFLMVFNETARIGVFEGRRATGEFRVRIPAAPGEWLQAYWMTGTFEAGLGGSPMQVPEP